MNPNHTLKKVDTREYITVLEDLLRNQKSVKVPVSGNSMSPFLISERDCVLVQTPKHPLKKGDIVLFKRNSGQFILHRICKIQNGEFYILGDAQTMIEGPVQREQIIGLVVKARRKGIWIDEGDCGWRFFQHVWIRIIPLRPFLRYMYGLVST